MKVLRGKGIKALLFARPPIDFYTAGGLGRCWSVTL